MFGILSRTTILVLVLTVIVAAATSGVLTYAYRVQGDVDLLYTREASYASNRLRYELSRFESAVHRAMYEPVREGRDTDYRLWYDIVWNRIDIITTSANYIELDGFETEERFIRQMDALHRESEGLFLSEPEILRAHEQRVLDYFETANRTVEQASMVASENRRRLVATTGDQLRDLYYIVFVLDSLTVVAFAGFAGLLIVQIRRQARQRQELEALSAQLQNALEAARTSIRHKDSFLAHMSHEFRTPLNAILGYTELITTRFGNDLPERCQDYISDVRTAGGQLLEFVNDLFDIARLHVLGTEIQREAVSAADVMEEAKTIATAGAPAGPANGARASIVVIPGEELSLRADRRRLVQVLINLLTNAIKHSGSELPVELSAFKDDVGNVVFRVRDAGVGMQPERAEHLFEPFWERTSGADVSKSGGLGLFISHELVALHGGRIDVVSAPGQGTTMDVVMPVDLPGLKSAAA